MKIIGVILSIYLLTLSASCGKIDVITSSSSISVAPSSSSSSSSSTSSANALDNAEERVYLIRSYRSTIEEKALIVAFDGSLLNTSWTNSHELNPDFLFEFYESLVIAEQSEYLEGATVPADIVEAAVAQHLDITPSYMQTSGYYNRDDHSYTVGGLGQVREITLDSLTEYDGTTSIEYTIYFQDKKQRTGLLTVEFGENNSYKYLSNAVEVED